MSRTSKADAPVSPDEPAIEGRYAGLDGYTAGFETHKADMDPAPFFTGLPDDRCQCPHWRSSARTPRRRDPDAVSDRGGGVRSRGERRPRGAPGEKGTAIMKLTVMTQITVDGVVQGNGGASDEDRRNGFERGGWAKGAGDDQTRTLITRTYQRADAFLFGRRTYELFAGSWGAIEQMRAHPIGVALKEAPKYVASTTLTAPRYATA